MFKKLLVANRSEIAIRILRSATELGIRTVAIYTYEDRFALHRFKADESYLIGQGLSAVAGYLAIDEIIKVALNAGVDAIHPGYGFLSENPDFATSCRKNNIAFIGPQAKTLLQLGNKTQAKEIAKKAEVPIIPASGALNLADKDSIILAGKKVGFPLMVKSVWGGGGRGMRQVMEEKDLLAKVKAASDEAAAAFSKGDVYLEKLIEKARHIEVQIVGDKYKNLVHLYERDCSTQRRHQKIVEVAPASSLPENIREDICQSALKIAKYVDYENAGTVEFLFDNKTSDFYFIEVNPRIQVEHTVTEEVTGIDLVTAQILIANGARIGKDAGVPAQKEIKCEGFAIQARITTEDPENGFAPSQGRILAYRGATGFGVRLDGGTAFSGALINPHYDSLLEKVTVWAPTRRQAIARMLRALREFRIRGIKTNLRFLESLITNNRFLEDKLDTRYIDDTPELFNFPKKLDRATKLLSYIADVKINQNPLLANKKDFAPLGLASLPKVSDENANVRGTREIFLEKGAKGIVDLLKKSSKPWLCDTSFRDAHQSLLATRMRTIDLVAPLPAYEQSLKNLFSLEVWGGATFDVALRFLKEDPWKRLKMMREKCPSILFQMLLRGSNAVGYTSYPDNAIQFFVKQCRLGGIDLFRVFDSLNWIDNMQVAMDAVLKEGGILEATICYSGDLLDQNRQKYNIDYYIKKAIALEKAGAHIIAIKDMAGLLKPDAAYMLVKALKEEVSCPLHIHTHDTAGGQIATLIKASEAGAEILDTAMDSLSGLTSQPSMGTLTEMLRLKGLKPSDISEISRYWSEVRGHYAPFESDVKSGTADVYRHEMPGGQYTNLREQANALGLKSKWSEVVKNYIEANLMFGDIVKVTPSSKVVGDMALFMVSENFSKEDVLDPDHAMDFPESVISLFKGEIGQPDGGFPKELQKKILKGIKPFTYPPGKFLEPIDLSKTKKKLTKIMGHKADDFDLASYIMYPDVFVNFAKSLAEYGELDKLSTPIFFFGPTFKEEFFIDLDQGKSLIIRLLAVGKPDSEGIRTVFFELNGQPRNVNIFDKAYKTKGQKSVKAEPGNKYQLGATMPGVIADIECKLGAKVKQGDALVTLEAMKIKTTLTAEVSGKIKEILVKTGSEVKDKDLLLVIEP